MTEEEILDVGELQQKLIEKEKKIKFLDECYAHAHANWAYNFTLVHKLRSKIEELDKKIYELFEIQEERRQEIEELEKIDGDCKTFAIIGGVSLGNHIIDMWNKKIKENQTVTASDVSRVMEDFFTRFERGNEKYIEERIKQKDLQWRKKIERATSCTNPKWCGVADLELCDNCKIKKELLDGSSKSKKCKHDWKEVDFAYSPPLYRCTKCDKTDVDILIEEGRWCTMHGNIDGICKKCSPSEKSKDLNDSSERSEDAV